MGCVIELVTLFMVAAELKKILFIFPFHYIMFDNIASRKKSLFVLEVLLLLSIYLKNKIYEKSDDLSKFINFISYGYLTNNIDNLHKLIILLQ